MKALQKVLAVLAVAGICTGIVALFVAMILPFGAGAVTCFGVALVAIPASCMVGWLAMLCDS